MFLKLPSWQDYMCGTHSAAKELAAEGVIVLIKNGKVIEPKTLKGIYRIRIVEYAQKSSSKNKKSRSDNQSPLNKNKKSRSDAT